MVWLGMSVRGGTELVIIDNNVDSVMYCKVLEQAILPFIADKYGAEDGNVIFQQDGAPSHTSKYASEWLMDASINTMVWLACSPDLNHV